MLKYRNAILSIRLLVIFFISCATFTKIKNYNNKLRVHSTIIYKNKKLQDNIIGFNRKQVILSNNKAIQISEIDTILFDSLFFSLPANNNIHFFLNNPKQAKFLQPYDLLYQYPLDSSKIELLFYTKNYSKVLVPHSKIGYIPLYIKNSEISNLSKKSSFFDFIFSKAYNAPPLTLKKQFEKNKDWLWYFKKYKYKIKYLKNLKAYIYSKPNRKSKILKTLYRGAEVFLIDSTKYYYKIIHSGDDITKNYIGYMKKGIFSDKVILNMTKEEAEKILLLQKRKEFIKKHKLSPTLENAILSGSIKEGMTKEMVLASWGLPYKKETKSNRFMFPYIWHYKKNGKHYILYFNKKWILQSIAKK